MTEPSRASQSPPGKVDPADRAGEEQVAREDRPTGREGDVVARVAGDADDLELDPGDA